MECPLWSQSKWPTLIIVLQVRQSLQGFMQIIRELLANSVSLRNKQVDHTTNNDISGLSLDKTSGKGPPWVKIGHGQHRSRTNTQTWELA